MDLQQFILRHVETVDHLRCLLLLRASGHREWNVTEVTAKLYLQPKQVMSVLGSLEAAGLIAAQGPKGGYHYQPRNEELANLVEELATLDRERPVTLIKLIYSRPDTLEAFADAFRLRKDS